MGFLCLMWLFVLFREGVFVGCLVSITPYVCCLGWNSELIDLFCGLNC